MIDIFDRKNYIIEEDDPMDTNFSSSFNTDNDDTDDSDEDNKDTEEQSNNDSDDNQEKSETDFTKINDDDNTQPDDEDNQQSDSNDGENNNENDEEVNNDDSEDDNDNMDDDSEDDENSDGPIDIIAKEKELYSTLLSDHDIKIRTDELKKSYDELYGFIIKLINMVVDVKKSNVNIKVLEYCESRLIELKNMTFDYITSNFSNNTYIQNQIRYKKTLFAISKITDLMNKISHKKEDN